MATLQKNKETFMGFEGLGDVLKAMFKHHQANLKNILLIVMTLVFLFDLFPFLEKWVWSPFYTFIIFAAVVTLDFVTAVAVNWEKEKFVTQKAIKFPFTLVAYLLLFGIVFNLPKVIDSFGVGDFISAEAFRLFAIGVYMLCFSINLVSAAKHLSILGLIPKAVANFITKFIDIHKGKVEAKLEEALEGEDANKETDGK